jgi:nicotinamidase-related amidase
MQLFNPKATGFVIGACLIAGTIGVTVLFAAGPSNGSQVNTNQPEQPSSQAPAKTSTTSQNHAHKHAGDCPHPEACAHPRGLPDAALPRYDIKLDPERVALVVTDPQNDFLSPDGVTWGVVGESVTENNTVEHIDQLFAAAHANEVPVFISPHYYFEHDHEWHFEGALESLMHQIGMFDRPNALTTKGFEGSGADWLEQYKPYINHENTVIVSPHKVYGPETNDLVLQLRKRGVDQIILAGMSANLCTESHMRELIEQGFEVIVVADATAAAKIPNYDGYEAAYLNYRFIANGVWNTDTAVDRMNALKSSN